MQLKYIVSGICPDGSVGLRMTCHSQERANLFADLWRLQHPDWKVTVRLSTGSSAAMDVIPPRDAPNGDS